ncbi:MAG: histidine kinase dimerization/phospho-acceptor domain-containing protein [Thermoanaerobaculia bacterium]
MIRAPPRRARSRERPPLPTGQEASRQKMRFLSAVSHDLRTPVNAILLHAYLARVEAEKEGSPDPAVLREWFSPGTSLNSMPPLRPVASASSVFSRLLLRPARRTDREGLPGRPYANRTVSRRKPRRKKSP